MKIQHGLGLHDDSLFSYLIGRYTLAYGTNLSRFQMPVGGKEPGDRKASIARMSYNLGEANRLSVRPNANRAMGYNGLANKEIEQMSYLELRKQIDAGGRIGIYTQMTSGEQLEEHNRKRMLSSNIWR